MSGAWPVNDRRELPGEVDASGIADAGVHALAAGRAMDMRRVAQQEGAAVTEMLRHAMVHVIGREPVHLPHLHLEVLDRVAADILERERIGMVGPFVPHGADQARAPLAGHGKDAQEVGFVEIGVQPAIDRRAGRFDVGHIEDLTISSAGISHAHRLAHDRTGTIAAGDVARLAGLLMAFGSAQPCADAIALVAEADQFGPSLDLATPSAASRSIRRRSCRS